MAEEVSRYIGHTEIEDFVRARLKIACHDLVLKFRPIRSGLDSTGVIQIVAQFGSDRRKRASRSFVVKRLSLEQRREAAIYKALAAAPEGIAPSLFWTQHVGDECRLYLEAVRPAMRWPWPDSELSTLVLTSLAELHRSPMQIPQELTQWDYCGELQTRGEELVRLLGAVSSRSELAFTRRSLPAVRRIVSALSEVRRQLLKFAPFKSVFIHGDVHPGNVILKRACGGFSPVLLDWGRSRLGSPLEDVSSWLQSLGYWEAEARRRHDTLLARYLEARRDGIRLTREVRDAYWLAAGCNLLGGAAIYHFAVANDPTGTPKKKERARMALRDCLRVLRRTDECWR